MQYIVRKRGHRILLFALLGGLLALALAVGLMNVGAVHNEGLFELEVDGTGASCPDPNGPQTPVSTCGNANTTDDSGAGAPFDWESICEPTNLTDDRTIVAISPKPTGLDQSSCNDDWQKPDNTKFSTGSKDIGDIAPGGFVGSGTWQCTEVNNVLEKDEIMNAYAALLTNSSDDHTNLYVGLERPSNNGTSFVGFWFIQEDVDCVGPSTGSVNWNGGLHTAGDLLILSDFSGGGRVSTVRVLQWDPSTDGAGCSPAGTATCNPSGNPACNPAPAADPPNTNLIPNPNVGPLCEIAAPGQDCSVYGGGNDDVCAVINNSTVTTPWWNQPDEPPCKKDGVNKETGTVAPCTVPMASNQLFEGGIDLTLALCPGGTACALPCFSTFIAETRSSDSETADLKDYTRGSFEVCGKARIIKQTDPPGASGTFTYTSGLPCGDFELQDADSTPADGETGVHTCPDLNPNTYYVTEDDPTQLSTPFDLVNVVCTVDNNPDGNTSYSIGTGVGGAFSNNGSNEFNSGDDTVKITIGTLGEVTCTFTNRQRGSILVRKEDEAGDLLPGACFTFDPDPSDATGAAVEVCDGDTADHATGNDGLVCIDNVVFLGDDAVPGSGYDITETGVPDGYEGDPDTENVVVDTTSNCEDRLAADPIVPDETFVNKLGSIFIKKVVDKAGNPLLGGACFTIAPDATTGTGTFTGTVCDNNVDNIPGPGIPDLTDADATAGEICVDDVPLDDYDITESVVPANFLGDTPKDVSVTNSDDCAALTAIVFKNVPLSKFQIKFFDLTGFTDAAIDCSNATEVSENGAVDSLTITTNTAANFTVITTSTAHGLTTGTKVGISGSDSVPSINGIHTVTVLSTTTFSIPVDLSGGTAGTAGTVVPFDDTDETFGNGTATLVPGLYSCTVNVDP